MATPTPAKSAPAPRLCRIAKRADFTGFGFNLHAGKVRQGQFIGKVDAGSPAQAAGLLPGDRIVEVNGVNIANENHKQVVQRIKMVADYTELLVVDEVADDYYAERGIVVRSDMPNVIDSAKTHSEEADADRRSSSSSSSAASSASEADDTEPVAAGRSPALVANGRQSVSSESSEDLSSAPAPRLCHVVKWNEGDGFGFHLLADKSRRGQYIGKVDPGSAADTAGLKLGDRIIEINGVNVIDQTHKEVVARIKSVPNETKILVIDPQGETYYKERNLTITSNQNNVRRLKTPAIDPRTTSGRTPVASVNPPPTKPHSSLKEISSAPAPRLCHIVKRNLNEGYGFHLMNNKTRNGNYIGKVDEGSVAFATGLRVGDRIVEVNGVNVEKEQHKQLVARIKAVPSETKLLVVDAAADAYYRERNIVVQGGQSNVQYIKTPAAKPTPAAASSGDDSSDDGAGDDEGSRVAYSNQKNGLSLAASRSPDSNSAWTPSVPYQLRPESPTSPTPRPLSMATLTAVAQTGLNLNMSAAELRARLASRKKIDPRQNNMELRLKHEIIKSM